MPASQCSWYWEYKTMTSYVLIMTLYCVKSVRIRSFAEIDFPFLDWMIQRISPYSVRMRENTNQKNCKYGHFSRSEFLHHPILCIIRKIWSKVSILGIIHLVLTQSFPKNNYFFLKIRKGFISGYEMLVFGLNFVCALNLWPPI